eukprot:5065126-Prymnesium_polylepis.1
MMRTLALARTAAMLAMLAVLAVLTVLTLFAQTSSGTAPSGHHPCRSSSQSPMVVVAPHERTLQARTPDRLPVRRPPHRQSSATPRRRSSRPCSGDAGGRWAPVVLPPRPRVRQHSHHCHHGQSRGHEGYGCHARPCVRL